MTPAGPISIRMRVLVCLITVAVFLVASDTWPPFGETVSLLGRIAWLYVVTGARG